jgi:hypothetical protein
MNDPQNGQNRVVQPDHLPSSIRRLLWSLDAHIEAATFGDKMSEDSTGYAAATFNLLNCFCYLVEIGQIPPYKLTAYVIYVLKKLHSAEVSRGKIHFIKKRFSDLRKQGVPIRESRIDGLIAATTIAKEFQISEDHAVKLLYKKSDDSVIGIFVFAVENNQATLDNYETIVPIIRKIAHQIISKKNRHSALIRSKLNIEAFRHRPEHERDQDIRQQFEHLRQQGIGITGAYRKIAKTFGLPPGTIKKIVQRNSQKNKVI